MIERLSHEPAPAPAGDDGRSDRLQALELLRAQLSRTISEGLEQSPQDLPTTRWPARSWLPRWHCWTKSRRSLRRLQRI
jgi:hypothetical protein